MRWKKKPAPELPSEISALITIRSSKIIRHALVIRVWAHLSLDLLFPAIFKVSLAFKRPKVLQENMWVTPTFGHWPDANLSTILGTLHPLLVFPSSLSVLLSVSCFPKEHLPWPLSQLDNWLIGYDLNCLLLSQHEAKCPLWTEWAEHAPRHCNVFPLCSKNVSEEIWACRLKNVACLCLS